MKRNKLTWWFVNKETGMIVKKGESDSLMVFETVFDDLSKTLNFIKTLDAQLSRQFLKLVYKIEEL